MVGPIQAVQTEVAAQAHAGLRTHAVTSNRKKVALVIAGLADLIQLGFFPFFGEGALSIPDDVLDIVVAVLLFAILGFKLRVLLGLAIELVPGIALFPSWTAVVATIPSVPAPKKQLPPAQPAASPEKLPETDAYLG